MKKAILFILIACMLFLGTACSGKNGEDMKPEPQMSQMKRICELATMECYYHNVAKYFEKDADNGFLGIGKKDKHFWIEYSGVVSLGIDVSLVKVEVDGTQVVITIPEAKILDCKLDSGEFNVDSFIVDKDSAKVTAQDEVKALGAAQEQLRENAANNRTLLESARQRAQELLEEYVLNIGRVAEKQYTIKWIYVDSNGNPVGSIDGENNASSETTTK